MKRLSLSFVLTAMLTAGAAHAQEWQLLASFPGRPANASVASISLNFEEIRVRWARFRDFDGDGIADQAFISKDGTEIRMIDGATSTLGLLIPAVNRFYTDDWIIGFVDFDGNAGSNGAVKEILLAEKSGRRFINPVVLYNIDPATGASVARFFDPGTFLLGLVDRDRDGRAELIIGDPNKKEVQIWGLK